MAITKVNLDLKSLTEHVHACCNWFMLVCWNGYKETI